MNLGDVATMLASDLPEGWVFPAGTRLSMDGVYSFLLVSPGGETVTVSLEQHGPHPLCWVCHHTPMGHYDPDPSQKHRVAQCRYCPGNECQAPHSPAPTPRKGRA